MKIWEKISMFSVTTAIFKLLKKKRQAKKDPRHNPNKKYEKKN